MVISFSADGGQTWQVIAPTLDDTEPEWGALPWSVPDQPTESARIWIQGYFGSAPTEVGFVIAAPQQQVSEDAGAGAPDQRYEAVGSCRCGGASAAPVAALMMMLGLGRRRRGG